MTRRRLVRTGTAFALGMLLICGLTSCTLPWKTASPWSNGTPVAVEPSASPPNHRAAPAKTPVQRTLLIPASGSSEIVRLIYAQGGTHRSNPVALPESSGYIVSAGCVAETPEAELIYTLGSVEPPYAIVQSGRLACNGTIQTNESSAPATEDTVQLWLSGDLDVIDSAFAILTLSRYAEYRG